MKISIKHDKKIVKRETTTQVPAKKSKDKVATQSAIVTSTETPVLSINDYGVFRINRNDETISVEGRVIEITKEKTSDGTPILVFRMDISTQYESQLTDIISTEVVNWTKAGEDTISATDLMKYTYQDDRSLDVDTGSVTITVHVDDIVTVQNRRTNEVKTGRVSSILNDQVSIDCSAQGRSDIYIIYSTDLSSGCVDLELHLN